MPDRDQTPAPEAVARPELPADVQATLEWLAQVEELGVVARDPTCVAMAREILAREAAQAARLREAGEEMARELHAAINEPMYAGTRADWIHRAQAAEAERDALRGRLEEAQEVLTALMNALTYYADPEDGWALVEHADAYEDARALLTGGAQGGE